MAFISQSTSPVHIPLNVFFEDLNVILPYTPRSDVGRRILQKQDGVVWTGLIWLGMGISGRSTEASGWEILEQLSN
jgi:hypothetical protein